MEYKQVPTDMVDDTGTPYEYAEVSEDGVVQAYKRSDGYFDIPLDLPDTLLSVVSDIAKDRGVSVNDLIVSIIEQAVVDKKQLMEARVLQWLRESHPEAVLTSHLERDLGMDSLDLVELMIDVEDEFNIELWDTDSGQVKTVYDVVKLVQTSPRRCYDIDE